jgi:citrate lyase subunit beta/citryl-CoA lyase
MHPARSYLYAPGNRPELLEKALGVGADAVIFDLEDGVAPAAKAPAREHVARALRAHRLDACIVVRVNCFGSDLLEADLRSVIPEAPAAVRLPKVEGASQLQQVSARIAEIENDAGLEVGITQLECTIESAKGLAAATHLAASDARVSRLVFGSADFATDIAARVGTEERELLFARSAIVVASRAAGLPQPVDGAYTLITDDAGLNDRCRGVRALGFGGCSAIHPRQVPIINRAFLPDDDEIVWARSVLEAFDAAAGRGEAVAKLADGSFVDRPVVEHARALLSRTGQP